MLAFRMGLGVALLGMGAYTAMVFAAHGMDFFTPFFGNILGLDWTGQFTLDFAIYLILSALWIAWRHEFSAGGIVTAAFASVLGVMVFLPYMLIITGKANGDMKVILLGEGRASA